MTTLVGLTPTQLKYAQIIVATCKARHLPQDQGQRAADIALETALAESGLRMYANANNPASMQLPHDAVGNDHGSVGLFQQQVGGAPHSTADWGSTTDLMNPVVSTEKFLDALLETNWLHLTNWEAAQAVQRSAIADGSNYRQHDAEAIEIRKALWNGAAPPPLKPVHIVANGDTLFSIAKAWGVTLQALEAANPGAGHPPGNFNTIHAGDRIVHP
ncbi:MAG: LysM peptidoglycan-binding domain-containing protein [Actinobacteria bacterium]|nr:LysM peptidoglycan-binding domain-containing protein [Actinomycetota bacterium]